MANTVPDIAARKLDVGYNGKTVVAGIDFELKEGQAIALIGTNGSGKSTLLKTIVGLLPPIGGEVRVFGSKPGSNPRRIAYLGQFHASGFVLPLRAIDVVRMGRFPSRGLLGRLTAKDNDIVGEAMRAMNIEKLADTPLRSLSGGQQQRVYLAQVLAHRADLLVMDEPTSGLDVGSRELYLQAVKDELCRGASVVVATHDVQEEAALCHQVMLLAHKVVALGPPDEVITPKALLETFGIVIGPDQKHLTVLECHHGHDGGRHHDDNS
ncbi:metal ABC transporter ATP-binding protein [Dehalogenimonas sp. THU2]|uniref:metal ABC transporter ATP-binding protein n=1 Tax=Dehalogenimonas sp. THU2 TaxID=3151121 RepID=UPI003218CE7D